jgi:hypothetical protein
MDSIVWRVRLAVLWVFAAGGWAVGFSINLLRPGVLEEIMEGHTSGSPITENRLLIYALLYIIPFVMAVLTLSLSVPITRWINAAVGGIFGLVMLADIAFHASALARGTSESLAIWLIMTAGLVAAALILLFCLRPSTTSNQAM